MGLDCWVTHDAGDPADRLNAPSCGVTKLINISYLCHLQSWTGSTKMGPETAGFTSRGSCNTFVSPKLLQRRLIGIKRLLTTSFVTLSVSSCSLGGAGGHVNHV